MNQLVACPDCGTPNKADADLCAQCWHALTDDLLSKIPAAAFAAATAPAAPAPPLPVPKRLAQRTVVDPVPPPVREATPGPVPYFAPPTKPGTETKTSVEPGWTPPLRRKSYEWKFRHLELIGFCAWGVPYFATFTLTRGKTGRSLIDAGLAVQVGAYLIAALAIACLVHLVQDRDWGSLGLNRTERTPLDLALGGVFGLVLIASFFGGYYLISGHFEPDFATRFLLGGTTGPGAVLGAIVLVVGAPVIEEVYFRGMLYSRLARWGTVAAVVGTAVLFTVAHGVGLWDPPRLLMGFALGFARRTKSLWFTIATHAAWNGAIVFLALFLMTGSGHDFTSTDGSFSLRHPAAWERVEQLEEMAGGDGVELMLSAPSGSFVVVGSAPSRADVNRWNLKMAAQQTQGALPMPPGTTMGAFEETHNVSGTFVTSYEARMQISDPALGQARGRVVLVLSEGSPSIVTLFMACPEHECAAADTEFDAMLKTLRFSA